MALKDLLRRRTKELADGSATPPANATSEIGVVGDSVFTGFQNEEQRTDRVSIVDYRRMLDNDGTVQALYNILTLPILALSKRIVADENDAGEVQADLIRNNLIEPPHKGGMEIPLDIVIEQMLQATLEGFQLFERVYKIQNGQYVYKKLAHRDSKTLKLLRADDGGFGGAHQVAQFGPRNIDVVLPAYKTFLFTYGKAHNYLYGRSAFKAAYRAYDKKRRLEYLDSIALQNDAIKPKLLKRTQAGALGKDGKAARSKALAALTKFGETRPVAAIPYGWDVDMGTSSKDGRDTGPSIERQNSEMARSILAQFIMLGTQGSSNVGSWALSSDQSDMFMIALKGLIQNIENHINYYLIPDLIDLNFSEAHYPELHFDDLTSDVQKVMTDAFQQLVKNSQISDAMVQGIQQSVASRLEIDLDKINNDLAKAAKKAAKQAGNDPNNGGNGGGAGSGAGFPGQQLSDDGILGELGIDTDDLGCIMLKTEPLAILKNVPNGADDLATTDADRSNVPGENEPHVTLLFGLMVNGNNIKPQVDKLLSGMNVPTVTIDEVGSFSVDDDCDSVPIVAFVKDDPALSDAHTQLEKLPHVDTHAEYVPHITLAYVQNDPDTINKWVEALGKVYNGQSIKTAGIDYGDPPADEDDDDDHHDLSDGQQWWRALTPAEQTVKLADLSSKMDGFEQQFIDAATPVLQTAAKQIAPAVAKAENLDQAALAVAVPDEYKTVVLNTIKSAYNYAKTGAADELKVNAPATSKDNLADMQQLTNFIVEKQTRDLINLVQAQWLTYKRTNQLADDNQQGSQDGSSTPDLVEAFTSTLLELLFNWIVNKIKPTASSIVSQAVETGRDNVFIAISQEGDVFQYSAILDSKVCPICKDLDGSVISPEQYATTKWRTPIHLYCRCLWIMIRKVAPGKIDTAIPAVTGVPDTAGGATGPML